MIKPTRYNKDKPSVARQFTTKREKKCVTEEPQQRTAKQHRTTHLIVVAKKIFNNLDQIFKLVSSTKSVATRKLIISRLPHPHSTYLFNLVFSCFQMIYHDQRRKSEKNSEDFWREIPKNSVSDRIGPSFFTHNSRTENSEWVQFAA